MADTKKIVVNKQELNSIFDRVIASDNAIYGVLFSTIDGHTIAKKADVDITDSRLSAMTSSCMALGSKISSELNQKSCHFLILQNELGNVALKRISKNYVITVIAKENVNLGLLLNATKNAEKSLSEIIQAQNQS